MSRLEDETEPVRVEGTLESEPHGRAAGPAAGSRHRQLGGEVGQVVVGSGRADPMDPEHVPHLLPFGPLIRLGPNGRPEGQPWRRSSTTGITLVVAFS